MLYQQWTTRPASWWSRQPTPVIAFTSDISQKTISNVFPTDEVIVLDVPRHVIRRKHRNGLISWYDSESRIGGLVWEGNWCSPSFSTLKPILSSLRVGRGNYLYTLAAVFDSRTIIDPSSSSSKKLLPSHESDDAQNLVPHTPQKEVCSHRLSFIHVCRFALHPVCDIGALLHLCFDSKKVKRNNSHT